MNDDICLVPVAGSRLRVIIDEPEQSVRGSVVLLPPFGMNSDSMFALAYVLTHNGLRVYRLAPRDHPDGKQNSMRAFRLSRLCEDISAALDTLHPDGLFAVSLAARPALRALAGGAGVAAAVLITPVVDVQYTLRQVLGEDFFDRVLWDFETTFVTVLGHDVDLDFIRDCMRHGFCTVEDSLADLAQIRARVSFLAGESDPWVDIGQVRRLADELNGTVAMVEIPSASHQLYRNPVLAMRFFAAGVDQLLSSIAPSAEPVVVPAFAEIVAGLERSRQLGRVG